MLHIRVESIVGWYECTVNTFVWEKMRAFYGRKCSPGLSRQLGLPDKHIVTPGHLRKPGRFWRSICGFRWDLIKFLLLPDFSKLSSTFPQFHWKGSQRMKPKASLRMTVLQRAKYAGDWNLPRSTQYSSFRHYFQVAMETFLFEGKVVTFQKVYLHIEDSINYAFGKQ